MRQLWFVLFVLIPIVGHADDRIEHRWRDDDWQTELSKADNGNYKCLISKGAKDPNGVAFGGGLIYGIDQEGHFTQIMLLLGDDDSARLPHVGEILRLVVDDKDIGTVAITEPRVNGVGAKLPPDKATALLRALGGGAKRLLVISPRARYNFISDGFSKAISRLMHDCPQLAQSR